MAPTGSAPASAKAPSRASRPAASADHQWHPVDLGHGSALARLAPTIRLVTHRLQPLLSLAARRYLATHPRCSAAAPRATKTAGMVGAPPRKPPPACPPTPPRCPQGGA